MSAWQVGTCVSIVPRLGWMSSAAVLLGASGAKALLLSHHFVPGRKLEVASSPAFQAIFHDTKKVERLGMRLEMRLDI